MLGIEGNRIAERVAASASLGLGVDSRRKMRRDDGDAKKGFLRSVACTINEEAHSGKLNKLAIVASLKLSGGSGGLDPPVRA